MPSSVPTSPHETHARYETLLEVAESIAAHRQLSTLFADLSRLLQRLVSFDYINLTLLDAKANVFRLHILQTDRDIVGERPSEIPFDESPSGLALRTRQPYYVGEVDEEGRFPALERLLKINGVQSYCVLPLVTAQRDLGGLSFGALRKNAYSPEDIEFMQQVARQVAVAVDNALNSEAARAYEEQLSRERDRLRALLEINNAVVSCLSSKPLFQAISASLRRTFGLDYASLLIYDAEIQALRLQMCDFPGGAGVIRENAVVPVDDTLAGYVFRTREGRVFSLEEAAAISRTTGDIMAREGLRSLCCMPLVSHGEALGTLNLGSRRENFFTASDLQFFAQAADQVAIALENALSFQRIEELNERLAEEKVYLEDEIRTDNRFEEIIGQSRVLKAVLKQVETVAPTESTVLIYGETGTGKELLARAIHDLGSRRQGTFVKLNCAAIPTGLLESEMFGHEKGAFTGAIAQRIGRFELAHRGTMFLDEVGEIPFELQTKLLRVLQEREFERLGSSRTIRTDARLVAATNRDLGAMVEERQFRADLYYRLNVFPITVPPLRERREDIPLLVRYFVQQNARRMNKRITSIPAESMKALAAYHWPGNIRELQNFIERAVIVSPGPALQAPVRELKGPKAAAGATVTLAAAEREAILRALRESGGKVGGAQGAAARLGMKRTTLQAKIRKLGIETRKLA
ncbi:MAG TPA: sigma 54-interacting transcriptional regulator [Bryobacteraceae bacterium]|nr:sigma 54-interacting transcriptional regulator [Bryobacteraceae bacterium]